MESHSTTRKPEQEAGAQSCPAVAATAFDFSNISVIQLQSDLCYFCQKWLLTGSIHFMSRSRPTSGYANIEFQGARNRLVSTCLGCKWIDSVSGGNSDAFLDIHLIIPIEEAVLHKTVADLVRSQPEINGFRTWVASLNYDLSDYGESENGTYFFRAVYTTAEDTLRLHSIQSWIPPSRFDLDIVKGWLKICSNKCITAKSETTYRYLGTLPSGFRLIDLDNMCLVDATDPPPYITLSYVWGPKDTHLLQLDNENKSMFYVTDFFNSPQVPNRLKDCMSLCKELGYHYIWIDRYCILQNDDTDRHHQIKAMHIIYNFAQFTLFCALDGNNSENLPGYQCDRQQQKSHFLIRPSWRYDFPIGHTQLEADIVDSVWNERGWTYQEHVLSRRRLYITNNSVIYQCSCGTASEHLSWRLQRFDIKLHLSFVNDSGYHGALDGWYKDMAGRIQGRFEETFSDIEAATNCFSRHDFAYLVKKICLHTDPKATLESTCSQCQVLERFLRICSGSWKDLVYLVHIETVAGISEYVHQNYHEDVFGDLAALAWYGTLLAADSCNNIQPLAQFHRDVLSLTSYEELLDWLAAENSKLIMFWILQKLEPLKYLQSFFFSKKRVLGLAEASVTSLNRHKAALLANAEAEDCQKLCIEIAASLNEELSCAKTQFVIEYIYSAFDIQAFLVNRIPDEFRGDTYTWKPEEVFDGRSIVSGLMESVNNLQTLLQNEASSNACSQTQKLLISVEGMFKFVSDTASQVDIQNTSHLCHYRLSKQKHWDCSPNFREPMTSITLWRDYQLVVLAYTERKLTNPTDSLNAFTGVLSYLRRGEDDVYICGFKEAFFTNILFWYILKPATRINHLLPSWSWGHVLERISVPARDIPTYMSFLYYLPSPEGREINVRPYGDSDISALIQSVKLHWPDCTPSCSRDSTTHSATCLSWRHPLVVKCKLPEIYVYKSTTDNSLECKFSMQGGMKKILLYLDVAGSSESILNAPVCALFRERNPEFILLQPVDVIGGDVRVFKRVGLGYCWDRPWDLDCYTDETFVWI